MLSYSSGYASHVRKEKLTNQETRKGELTIEFSISKDITGHCGEASMWTERKKILSGNPRYFFNICQPHSTAKSNGGGCGACVVRKMDIIV